MVKGDINGAINEWFMLRGLFKVNSRGRIQSKSLAMGAIGDINWENYIIDVNLYNPTEAFILFRVQDKKNYGRIKMRFWRELVVGFSYYKDGKQSFNKMKSLTESVEDGLRSLILRFVKVYAVAACILIAFLTFFTIVAIFLRPFLGTSEGRNM